MNAPGTAREALIVEVLGEVASLLDRVDSVTTSMEVVRLALANASADLDRKLKAFELGTASMAQQLQSRAVEHVLRRTAKANTELIESQTQAMNEAARSAFSTHVNSNLARLTISLQQVLQRVDRPWDLWLTHATTAAVSAALTWWLVSSSTCR